MGAPARLSLSREVSFLLTERNTPTRSSPPSPAARKPASVRPAPPPRSCCYAIGHPPRICVLTACMCEGLVVTRLFFILTTIDSLMSSGGAAPFQKLFCVRIWRETVFWCPKYDPNLKA